MDEWAYSGENVVNLCTASRTTTMEELRIAVAEMRNEYHISSALLPAISTLDSCYLLLHLQVLFRLYCCGFTYCCFASIAGYACWRLPYSRYLQLNTERIVCISFNHSLPLSHTLTAGKLIGSRCGRSVLNFILTCRKTTSYSINNIIFVG